MWQVFDGGKPALRITVENIQTRELQGYSDLDGLINFLRSESKAISERPIENPLTE
jgi:hypothetical protein